MGNREKPQRVLVALALLLLVGSLAPVQVLAQDAEQSYGSTELWVRYDAGKGDGGTPSGDVEDASQIRQVVASAKEGASFIPRLGDAQWRQTVFAIVLTCVSVLMLTAAFRAKRKHRCIQGGRMASLCVLAVALTVVARPALADDLCAKRLLIWSDERPEYGTVLSHCEGLWLVGFPTTDDARQALEELRGKTELVVSDGVLELRESDGEDTSCRKSQIANDGDTPLADLSPRGTVIEENANAIALIDTGVSGYDEHVVQRLSVIGDVVQDDHGHGTSALRALVEANPSCEVVSIKAFDAHGVGTVASVCAAIQSATRMGAKAISLASCAPALEDNAVVEQVLNEAKQKGVVIHSPVTRHDEGVSGQAPARADNEDANTEDFLEEPSALEEPVKTSDPEPALGLETVSEEQTTEKPTTEAEPTTGQPVGEREPVGDAGPQAEPLSAPHEEPVSQAEPIEETGPESNVGPTQEPQRVEESAEGADAKEAGQKLFTRTMRAAGNALANGAVRASGVKYTLTVRTNGGVFVNPNWGTTVYSSRELEYNESTYCEINWLRPQRAGYAFAGWYTAASGGTMIYGTDGKCKKGTYWNRDYTNGSEVYIYKGDLTVYAHWTPLAYRQVIRVRYQQSDGSYGEYANALDEDRDYDTTVSWSKAESTTYEAASVSYVVTGEKTTSVSIKRKKYVVAFSANGGTGTTENQTFYRGQSKALRKNGFTKNNYSFAGWNTKADGSGTSYANKQSVSNLAAGGESITLYAQWEAEVYRIVLDNQSATNAGSAAIYQKYASGVYLDSRCTKAMTASEYRISRPRRPGYTFGGYFTEPNGGGSQLISPSGYKKAQLTSTYFEQDGTLYARWRANTYTICYDGNGGTGTMENQTVSDDAAGTALRANQFQKSGSMFMGWSLESMPLEAQDMSATSWWSIPSQASVNHDADLGKSTITFSTVSNTYENISSARPIRVVPGRTYTLSCTYRTARAYTLASGCTWFGLSVHSAAQGNADVSDLLAHTSFSTSAMAAGDTVTATFTAPAGVCMAYFSLNGGHIADGASATFEIYNISVTSDYRFGDQEVVRDLSYRGTVTMKADWAAWDYAVEFVNHNEYVDIVMPVSQGANIGDSVTLPSCENADDWEFLGWEVQNGPRQGEALAAGSVLEDLAESEGSHIVLAARWRLTAAELFCGVSLEAQGEPQRLVGNEYTFEAMAEGSVVPVVVGANDAEGLVRMRVEDLLLGCGDSATFGVRQVEGAQEGVVYDLEPAKAVVSVGGTPTTPLIEVRYAKPEAEALALAVPTFVNRMRSQAIVVSFDPACDDAEGEMDDLEIAEGDSLLLPACAFERELFYFVGWGTAPDGTGAHYGMGATIEDVTELASSEGTVVFYAQWEARQLAIAVPVGLHFVADSQGLVSGPTNGVACIQNLGDTYAELDGIRAESFDPWMLVGEDADCLPSEFSLGMRLGDDERRLDFAELDGSRAHYAWIGSREGIFLNDLDGRTGSGADDANVGCIHWHFRAAKASEVA